MASCHGGPNDFSFKYEFTGVSVFNGHNLNEDPEISSLDSIPLNTYVTEVILAHEIMAEGHGIADWDHPPENLNRIDSLAVTSNADFNINYPAGSLLNDNFMYFSTSYFNLKPLDNFQPSEANSNYAKPISDTLHFVLMEEVAYSTTHIFKIELFLDDGTVLTDSTDQIKLY